MLAIDDSFSMISFRACKVISDIELKTVNTSTAKYNEPVPKTSHDFYQVSTCHCLEMTCSSLSDTPQRNSFGLPSDINHTIAKTSRNRTSRPAVMI